MYKPAKMCVMIVNKLQTHKVISMILKTIIICVPVHHPSAVQWYFYPFKMGFTQDFMQNQIIASYTCFGRHTDVNC